MLVLVFLWAQFGKVLISHLIKENIYIYIRHQTRRIQHTYAHTNLYNRLWMWRKGAWAWIWMCFWLAVCVCVGFFCFSVANIRGHHSNCCDEMTTTTHSIKDNAIHLDCGCRMVNVRILPLLLLVQRASQTINQSRKKGEGERKASKHKKKITHTEWDRHTHTQTHLYITSRQKFSIKKYHRRCSIDRAIA